MKIAASLVAAGFSLLADGAAAAPVSATLSAELERHAREEEDASVRAALNSAMVKYRLTIASGAEENSQAMLEAIAELNQALAATGRESDVSAETARPGARVYYQRVGRSEVEDFDKPTKSSHPVPWGIYEMWTQRGSRVTSARKREDITRPREELIFEETQP